MNTDPDTMTPEQLRDALALAAGWTLFDPPVMGSIRFTSHKLNRNAEGHPIPSLDSPDALGLIAGMMPKPFCVAVYEMRMDAGYVWQAVARPSLGDKLLTAQGPTEAIARAMLVLKVLAATKTPAV